MASVSAKITIVEAVETLIQYQFSHLALLWEALQCPSSPNSEHPNGNKRLAIIGDTVLQLGLAEDWFLGDGMIGMKAASRHLTMKHVGWDSSVLIHAFLSGEWSQIRQSVTTNANLQRVGLELGLERFIGVGNDASSASTRAVADTVKAILGAVYLDSGIPQVKDVMDALGLVSGEHVSKEHPPEREASPARDDMEVLSEHSPGRDESEVVVID